MPEPSRAVLSGGFDLGDAGYVLLMIVVFILIMAGAWFGLKWLSNRGFAGGGNRSRHMRILDRLVIAKDSYLLLLEVAGRVFVVAVGRQSSELICELDGLSSVSEEAPPGTAAGRPAPKRRGRDKRRDREKDGGSSFWRRFGHNMKLNFGLLPKGTPPMTPNATKADTEPSPRETADAFKSILEKIQHAQDEQSNPNVFSEEEKASGDLRAPEQSGGAGREQSAQTKPPAAYTRHTKPVYEGREPQVDTDYRGLIDNMRSLGSVGDTGRSVPAPNPVRPPAAESPPAPAEKPIANTPSSSAARAYAQAGAQGKSGTPRAESESVPPASEPASEAVATESTGSDEGRQDKYDMMFDLIARRQEKYTGGKGRGKEGR